MLASRPVELWQYRGLLRNLVLRDLRIRDKGSTLGFAWSLLNPLLMAAVYTLAFRYIVGLRVEYFPVFVLAGLLPWMFFSSALSMATGAVADNGTLVRKVAFPRAILPLGAVLSQFVQFVLMYCAIVPIAVVLGSGLWGSMAAIIPLALLQLLFTAGLALAFATAYVYFRDTRHLLEVLLQVWFWLTPIIYPLNRVPLPYRRLFVLNPMALFAEAYQNAVLGHGVPSVLRLTAIATVACCSALAGLAIFRRHERRFAELV